MAAASYMFSHSVLLDDANAMRTSRKKMNSISLRRMLKKAAMAMRAEGGEEKKRLAVTSRNRKEQESAGDNCNSQAVPRMPFANPPHTAPSFVAAA